MLHDETLHVLGLLCRVLESALAAPVDGNLAILLHLELDRAILAEKTGALEQPIAVAKSALRHDMRRLGQGKKSLKGGSLKFQK